MIRLHAFLVRGFALGVLATLRCLVVTGLMAGSASAATRVHVRGQARVEAQAARDAGDLILSGALHDDAGLPLAGEGLTVSLAREENPDDAVSIADEGRAKSCGTGARETSSAPRPASSGGAIVVTTDDAGRFCVRLTVAQGVPRDGVARDKYVTTIAWGGTALVEGTKLALPVDTGRPATTLRFDPEPHILTLDHGPILVEVAASYEENQTTHAGTGLPIYLTNERGDALAAGTTNGAGVLRATIPPERLGPPGLGELRAAFPGNDELAKGTRAAHVERHARVRLEVASTFDASRPASPEDGIPIGVVARTGFGAVPTGSVEARLGDAVVGAATLENGTATVIATFALAEEVRDTELRLHFLPSAPWFETAEDTAVRVSIRGSSPLRQIPLAIAGLAVVAWLVVGRIKRVQPTLAKSEPPKPAVEGEARVEVVRATRNNSAGWSGRVTDAHDGTPVAGARVRVERAGFERATVIASAFANDAGRFELRPSDAREFDELVIEGPLHTELRQPLPSRGELDIALVLRKRKLLERLVAWAKRRGRPFDSSPEPTPGHVRRAAGDDFATARWADAVERAAYAGGAVDARIEAEIDRLGPVLGQDRPAADAISEREATRVDPNLTVVDPEVAPPSGEDRGD